MIYLKMKMKSILIYAKSIGRIKLRRSNMKCVLRLSQPQSCFTKKTRAHQPPLPLLRCYNTSTTAARRRPYYYHNGNQPQQQRVEDAARRPAASARRSSPKKKDTPAAYPLERGDFDSTAEWLSPGASRGNKPSSSDFEFRSANGVCRQLIDYWKRRSLGEQQTAEKHRPHRNLPGVAGAESAYRNALLSDLLNPERTNTKNTNVRPQWLIREPGGLDVGKRRLQGRGVSFQDSEGAVRVDVVPSSVRTEVTAEAELLQRGPSEDDVEPQRRVLPMEWPFPQIYPCQQQLSLAVAKAVLEKKHAFIETPPGTGKTAALLCAALAAQRHLQEKHGCAPQILYGTRTHAQMAQIVDTVKRTAYAAGVSVQCLGSRTNAGLCSNTKIRSASGAVTECRDAVRNYWNTTLKSSGQRELVGRFREFKEHAQAFGAAAAGGQTAQNNRNFVLQDDPPPSMDGRHSCSRLHRMLDPKFIEEAYTAVKGQQQGGRGSTRQLAATTGAAGVGPLNLEQLSSKVKDLGGCPYFLSRAALYDADIVVMPYGYLLDPQIRDATFPLGAQEFLNDKIVILDEAHNIDGHCREACSFEVSTEQLLQFETNLQVFSDVSCADVGGNKNESQVDFSRYDDLLSPARPETVQEVLDCDEQYSGRNLKFAVNYIRAVLLRLVECVERWGDLGAIQHERAGNGASKGGFNNRRSKAFAEGLAAGASNGRREVRSWAAYNAAKRTSSSSNSSTPQAFAAELASKLYKDDAKLLPQFFEFQLCGMLQRELAEECRKMQKKQTFDEETVSRTVFTVRELRNLFEKLKNVFANLDDYVVGLSKAKQQGLSTTTSSAGAGGYFLDFYLVNASSVLDEVTKPTHSVILSSGTLCAELGSGFFQRQVRGNFVRIGGEDGGGAAAEAGPGGAEKARNIPLSPLRTDHVISKDQLLVQKIPVLLDGKTKFTTDFDTLRGEEDAFGRGIWNRALLTELGRSLLQLVSKVPEGVLVFFPSYPLLKECASVWKQEGVWDALLSAKREITKETEKANMDKLREQHNKAVDEHGHGLLLGVMRGKCAEGISYNDGYARGVVVIGIPYPTVNSASVFHKRQHNSFMNKKLQLSGNSRSYSPPGSSGSARSSATSSVKRLSHGDDWYRQEAFTAVNQSLGRCIRHDKDYGAVFLLDARWDLWYEKELPDWVLKLDAVKKLEEGSRGWGRMLSRVEKFFAKNEKQFGSGGG